jgi:V-type H+-transporting ATPase subunit D
MSQRVLPSRAQLIMWKAKLNGAKKGYDLLKKKLDGLKKKFRDIMLKIIEVIPIKDQEKHGKGIQ